MSAEQVANAFTQHYYQTFDSNPDALVGLFVSLLWHCIASLRRQRVQLRRTVVPFLALPSSNNDFLLDRTTLMISRQLCCIASPTNDTTAYCNTNE